jgi:hypothetical protein
MNRKLIFLVAIVFVALGIASYVYAGHSTPKGQPAMVRFSSDGPAPLKAAFNASASSIRVIVMLSPT